MTCSGRVINTTSLFPSTNIQRLHLTIAKPIIPQDIIQWVINSGIDIDEIWAAIFIVLTPDGIEAEYFNIFSDHIRDRGYVVGTAEYWQVNDVATLFLDLVLKQYVYSPAFEYVIRGVLVDVNIGKDTIVLSVDYED